VCFAIIVLYALVALASWMKLTPEWNVTVGGPYEAPSLDSVSKWLGTDIFGRSVLFKTIHGTQVAMMVGFVSALIAVRLGIFFGAVAGYFGGWVDDLIVWFYTTLSSIP